MSARSMVLVLALALAAPPAADAQRSRGGSRGGGQSGGHSGGHPGSPHGRSASPRQPGQRPPTTAERRHPRAGTGTGYYQTRHYGYPYYRPYYGGYYGYPYYYGYGGYWGYPYYYAPGWGVYGYWGYPYGGVSVGYASAPDEGGAVRLIIEPVATQVYVDGHYAGVVDDYDGIFQRLRLSPGRHEIRLELEGYQTQTLRVAVQRGQTLKISHEMAPGDGEAAVEELEGYAEAPPARSPPNATAEPRARIEAPSRGWDDGRAPAWVATIPRDAARIQLEVTPADASVYVDGQFRGLAAEVGSLALSPGQHSIEIVRPGHRTFSENVEVRAGEQRSLSVRLDPVV